MRAIRSLDEQVTNDAAHHLAQQVIDSGFSPTLVVGIETGGAQLVTRIDWAKVGASPRIGYLTCRRRSTTAKKRFNLRALLRRMPGPVNDILRRLEHWWRECCSEVPAEREVSADELPYQELGERGVERVLVMDDAVDSGATLDIIDTHLRGKLPAESQIRHAAVTVTRTTPIRRPDYALYEGVLCRFPWSDDF